MPTTLTSSDSFTLSDALTIALRNPQDREGGDNLFLSDSVSFLVGLRSNPSDQLSLSDFLQIQRSISFAFTDSLSLSGGAAAPVLAVQLLLVLSDSLSLSDTISATPSTATDLYLRRYLNDVA